MYEVRAGRRTPKHTESLTLFFLAHTYNGIRIRRIKTVLYNYVSFSLGGVVVGHLVIGWMPVNLAMELAYVSVCVCTAHSKCGLRHSRVCQPVQRVSGPHSAHTGGWWVHRSHTSTHERSQRVVAMAHRHTSRLPSEDMYQTIATDPRGRSNVSVFSPERACGIVRGLCVCSVCVLCMTVCVCRPAPAHHHTQSHAAPLVPSGVACRGTEDE